MFLELKDVHFSYMRGTPLQAPVLRGINLSIKEGEIVAIVGPNGCGKSTLIQHCNGLLEPDKGKVYVEGRAIGETVPARLVRKKIGLVFQFPERQLFEETVFDEVAFGARNVGCREAELKARVQDALLMVGLDYNRIKDRSPFSLSGGEMRRVAIAGVLAMRAQALILDEPMSGLDFTGKQEILGTVKRLKNEDNLTVVLVSHEIDEIVRVAERIIVLEKGRIILDDAPEKVLLHGQELEKLGVGIPQVTSLMVELAANGFEVPVNIFDLEQARVALLQCFKPGYCNRFK